MNKMRRPFAEIRSIIQQKLQLRPMGLWELCVECKLRPEVARKHLLYLEDLSCIKRSMYKIRISDGTTKDNTLWSCV